MYFKICEIVFFFELKTQPEKESPPSHFRADYFENLGKEDRSMIFDDWDWDMYIDVKKEEARLDSKLEIAYNALAMGLSAEQVIQITSLPREKVLALQNGVPLAEVAKFA